MIGRLLVIAAFVVAWLAAGAGIRPASASALLIETGATPYVRTFVCPPATVFSPPLVACL